MVLFLISFKYRENSKAIHILVIRIPKMNTLFQARVYIVRTMTDFLRDFDISI